MATQGLASQMPVHRAGPIGASGEARTFFASRVSNTVVHVTAGAINSQPKAAGNLTITSGQLIYIELAFDAEGSVSTVAIGHGTTVPDDAFDDGVPTDAYLLIAMTDTVDGTLVVSPVAWNVIQVQACGGQVLWGGFA